MTSNGEQREWQDKGEKNQNQNYLPDLPQK
jgi:hypothetical protein